MAPRARFTIPGRGSLAPSVVTSAIDYSSFLCIVLISVPACAGAAVSVDGGFGHVFRNPGDITDILARHA